jgi:pimeloyl-ACP methyl ester carboxylesterase
LNESLFKSSEGERLVRESYQRFLKHWPVPNEQLHIPTAQGSTFVVVSGAKEAPPLLLLHGSAANSAMWMGDVRIFAMAFRAHRTHLHELSINRKSEIEPVAALGSVVS